MAVTFVGASLCKYLLTQDQFKLAGIVYCGVQLYYLQKESMFQLLEYGDEESEKDKKLLFWKDMYSLYEWIGFLFFIYIILLKLKLRMKYKILTAVLISIEHFTCYNPNKVGHIVIILMVSAFIYNLSFMNSNW